MTVAGMFASTAASAQPMWTSIPQACDHMEWRNGFWPYVVRADHNDFLNWKEFGIAMGADNCDAVVRWVDESGTFITGTAQCFTEGGADNFWVDLRIDKIDASVLRFDFAHTYFEFDAHACQ